MSEVINAKMVGDLRSKTGAGLMDCKRALVEANGDFEEATNILRKKGVASAEKKAGRDASEGLVESYIHLGGKVGVLVELNCETDFVAKNEGFHTLARDIAMHIAAVSPSYVSREDVPEDLVAKEAEIAAAQAEGKPPQAIQKIVEGKLEKYFATVCLLEQPFVKNSEQSVKEILTENIAKLGENIVVKRFSRFQIGN
ncbi:MAG: translation elongation factor Ts [Puniceicoccaceae bacterium]